MSAQTRPQERPDQTALLLESISPGLSSAVLQEETKTPESIDTVLFAFNPWCPIPNVTLAGFTFGIQHVVLPRMCLIPLKTWKTPVIQPRASGWAPGSVTQAGFFPAGAVGSKVDQRYQFPSESAKFLIGAFGRDSANDVGMILLRSLGAVSDEDKLESVLIFRGVMETRLAKDGLAGVETCLELLPKFLNDEAPKLIARMMSEGLLLRGGHVYKFQQSARRKAEVLVEDLIISLASAHKSALDENSGVLPKTKRDLIAASKGLKDVKVLPDKRDEFLMREFPSFNLDINVEQMVRGNASLIDAVRNRRADEDLTLRDLLDMNRETLAQLARANDLNEKMAERLNAAQSLSQAPVEPDPPAAATSVDLTETAMGE